MDWTKLFDGLIPWLIQNLVVLIPPMVLITAAIQVFRDGAVSIIGGELPVPGSPRDHARSVALFAGPFVCGWLYMWSASGWWASHYNAKHIFLGGLGLGIINTVFYRYLWKPYLVVWIKNILIKKTEVKP
jgi:hypothetical protein